MKMNIGEVAANRAYLSPEIEGFIGKARRYTFKQMNDRINQFSHFLKSLSVQAGERMALLCKNNEGFITAFFGAAKIGVITIPVNWRLSAREVEYILEDCGASILIYDEAFSELVESIKEKIPVRIFVQSEGLKKNDPLIDELISDIPSIEPEYTTFDTDPILFMYTSGTTGKPKGAVITHRNLLFASVGISHIVDWWYGDRFLSVAPFFHIGGFAPIITNLHNGCTSILMEDFHPIEAWKLIEKEKITTMMSVPAMLTFMLQAADAAGADFSTLRNITCGASVVPASLIKAYDKLGIPIQQVYGISEYTGAVSFWKKTMDPEKYDSMGKMVFHGKVKIVNPETKEELPAGEIGEIALYGPQVFIGYWNKPDETSKVLKDGWYYSGDLGRVDEQGFLYVIDRLKDMIISGGENIYSAELEAVITLHENVLEAAVIGVPDPKWGEIPKAYLVAKTGQTVTEEEIFALCKQNLASYKCVKEVEFIEQLPRNAVGKILKMELKKRAVPQAGNLK